jgi:transposase
MDIPGISASWLKFIESLNEAQLRWCAAQKALDLGRGGLKLVHEATGISQTTIIKAMKEFEGSDALPDAARVRRAGGGRKSRETADPTILRHLERIVSENTAGDPMSNLKWTVKSSRTIAAELAKLGHAVGHDTVRRLLHDDDYSLQANQKTLEGNQHPARDSQFRYINKQAALFVKRGDPVLSVDSKKRELVGNFKNAGQTYRKKGQPLPVEGHDFRNRAIGVAIPYGIFDQRRNHGMVNIGTSKDTAEFAVESLRQWWRTIGRTHYGRSKQILLCADGGGSNSSRSRTWRARLQDFVDETNVTVTVCHYPPGTSKWNKIEHRMFSFISINWKGKPLTTYETVIKLIGNTTTTKGLKIDTHLDQADYKTGLKVTKAEMSALRVKMHAVNPQWNYTVQPRARSGHAN